MNRASLTLALLIGGLHCAGCVERHMTILSDPPGANVVVNGYGIGATPADVPSRLFTYYGDYEFVILRDGYEPLRIKQHVPAPWYEWFPLDFISENLIPWTIRDRRVFEYQLVPPTVVDTEQLLENAEVQRNRARGIVTPVELSGPPDAASEPVPAESSSAPVRLEPPVPEN